ncbi:MAG: SprT family zinc-dependent metalloprotease [Verrucomicrobiota bacterium]
MQLEVQYGRQRIGFSLELTARRNLTITVDPNLWVCVTAPPHADIEAVRKRVLKRARWIISQRNRFATYLPKPPSAGHRSGESIRYLGRQFRLRIIRADQERVVLGKLGIEVHVGHAASVAHAGKLLENWFDQRARTCVARRFAHCLELVRIHGIEASGFALRKMPKRWGSCTLKGRLLLNPNLVKTPTQCIDYVIVHELCHLREHGHTPAFYRLLTKILPDWPKRKAQLERCVI